MIVKKNSMTNANINMNTNVTNILIRWGITCHGDDSAGDGAGDGCRGRNGDGDMIQIVMVMVKATVR